jgi:hypothetical protein
MEKIDIVHGLTMPFFPMRPTKGRSLRAPRLIEELANEIKKSTAWVAQPKMTGDRACLAVVDRKIYIQNDRGGWYSRQVNRTHDFLRLPNRTLFDGIVYDNEFHPFDLLALDGKSFVFRSASEREVMAFQMVRFIEHSWQFSKPTEAWMKQRTAHLPKYEGVVLKDANSHYLPATSAKQVSRLWFQRDWA